MGWLDAEDSEDTTTDDTSTDDGTTDDTSTNDGSSNLDTSGFVTGWSDLNIPNPLQDLQDYSDQLIRIAKNPKSFVIGALVAWILGGILEVTYIFFDGMRIALVGTGLGYAEGDVAGIEDLMYIAWDIISGAGEAIGSPILDIVSTIQTSLTGLAESAGLFSFPLTVGMLAIFLVASYIVLNRVGWATLAAIPIVGPMMEALFK